MQSIDLKAYSFLLKSFQFLQARLKFRIVLRYTQYINIYTYVFIKYAYKYNYLLNPHKNSSNQLYFIDEATLIPSNVK